MVAIAAALAALLERSAGRLPRAARIALLAVLLKPSFALRALLEAGGAARGALDRNDLPAARDALSALVSRGTAPLGPEEVAGAAIESLAENTTDSFVGPWLAWLLFGLPGAWAFRAVNTLDSRWGYHGRYELLGRVPARLDDVCAALPARLSAIVLIAAAPLCGASAAGALRILRRDRRRTGSPNSGWTMAAMAGALGRRLRKRGAYVLNAGGAPAGAEDIVRAQWIVALSAALALAAAVFANAVHAQRQMVTTCRHQP
jgi:adenosylcobinamide-phosphate synthase